jgi:diaminopimelate epimerase
MAAHPMKIPFTKAHGARNDFLLTWAGEAPAEAELAEAAVAICDRHAGVGADGWLIVHPPEAGRAARIRLFNPDGGEVEMSGNGTRCAAAVLAVAGFADGEMTIETGAGARRLWLLERNGPRFLFEMDMGAAEIAPGNLRHMLPLAGGARECSIVWVGNPQCVFFTGDFEFNWRTLGAEVERHPRFPNRTNASFVKVVDRHTVEARFFERGAGFTMSSGTGSAGAVAAALARGLVESPVAVNTLAGPLHFREEGGALRMQGPAEIVARGEFFYGERE